MKAQDYADKYLPRFLEGKEKSEEELQKIGNEVFLEFVFDMESTLEKRGIKKGKSVQSLILEINQKWNKFCRIINEKQDIITMRDDLIKKRFSDVLGMKA